MDPDSFIGKSYQNYYKKLFNPLLLFLKIEKEEFANSFCKASVTLLTNQRQMRKESHRLNSFMNC